MWSTILTAIATILGKLALSFLEGKQQTADVNEKAVSDAASQTSQDTAVIADAQAQNNVVDRGGAADVAARLRKHLSEQQSGNSGPNAG